MTYALGIDLGTSYTAAAIWKDGRAETVPLGNRAHSVPSAVFLRPDGVLLVGEAAMRRGVAEPERLARGFKRRFGDPTPYLIGGSSMQPQELTGHLLRWVADTVTEREGGPPAHVTLTCPATWRGHERDLITQAATSSRLTDVGLLPEPVAAAAYYASQQRLQPGATIAVYDLGGGTFDATVVVTTNAGFEVHGTPGGNPRIGGEDFDEVVMNHVVTTLRVPWQELDTEDPTVLAGVAQVRLNVVEAKEALSADLDATIPVILPNVTRDIRITRGEFESGIRIPVLQTVYTLADTIEAAGLQPADLHSVLLIGGSSRIPLVSRLIAQELGVPVAVDAHPKYAVCLGAAISAGARLSPSTEAGSATASAAPPLAPLPPVPAARTPECTPPPAAQRAPESAASPPPESEDSGAELLATAPTVEVDLDRPGLRRPGDVTLVLAATPTTALPRITDRDEPLMVTHQGDPVRGRRIAIIVGLAVVALIAAFSLITTLGDRPATVAPVEASPTSRLTPTADTGPAATLVAQRFPSRKGDMVRAVTGTSDGNLTAVGSSSLTQVPRAWLFRHGRWTSVTGPTAGTRFAGGMNGIAAGSPGAAVPLVAVGWTADRGAGDPSRSRHAAIWTSTAGDTWKRLAAPPVGELFDVAALPGGFLASGVDWAKDASDGDGVLLTSADGRTWTRLAATGLDGPGPAILRRLLPIGQRAVLAVGVRLEGDTTRSLLWRSADRVTWAPVMELPSATASAASAWGICPDRGSGIVVTGGSSGLGGTLSPLIWAGPSSAPRLRPVTSATSVTGMVQAVIRRGSSFVAVGFTTKGADVIPAAWTLRLS